MALRLLTVSDGDKANRHLSFLPLSPSKRSSPIWRRVCFRFFLSWQLPKLINLLDFLSLSRGADFRSESLVAVNSRKLATAFAS